MYTTLVSILRTFIRAGRTGNWLLPYLFPYLAAAGHHNYTKFLVLYLTQMEKLQYTNPYVYIKFVDDFFVLRRAESCRARIYSDLYIEQVLMKNVKAVGGLTRGRGFDQTTSLVWFLSSPACAEVNRAMRDFTSLHDTNTRDDKVHYSKQKKKFFIDSRELLSLSSGFLADKFVDVDRAESLGQDILQSMYGESVAVYTFRKRIRSPHVFLIHLHHC